MLSQDGFDRLQIIVQSRLFQQDQLRRQLLPGNERLMGFHDAGMRGSSRVIANQQFFVEFFTRAQSGNGNFDITGRAALIFNGQARQTDHPASQVHDLDGLSHIQHKYVSALRHGTRLQDQLSRFRNSHEVSRYLRVSDR